MIAVRDSEWGGFAGHNGVHYRRTGRLRTGAIGTVAVLMRRLTITNDDWSNHTTVRNGCVIIATLSL